ncbi:hypothetical protein PAPYR_8753 [Paratrimastix pyriformis]|uniref:Uncharacterized protein n=1 Tax=Paratrimastix pyriformis TaxID=342808 RepID=A0ABQ8UA09_9EUKA|nr:hypothetical protein PAPYR_8753 [Paratrimastix pyriformis]
MSKTPPPRRRSRSPSASSSDEEKAPRKAARQSPDPEEPDSGWATLLLLKRAALKDPEKFDPNADLTFLGPSLRALHFAKKESGGKSPLIFFLLPFPSHLQEIGLLSDRGSFAYSADRSPKIRQSV